MTANVAAYPSAEACPDREKGRRFRWPRQFHLQRIMRAVPGLAAHMVPRNGWHRVAASGMRRRRCDKCSGRARALLSSEPCCKRVCINIPSRPCRS